MIIPTPVNESPEPQDDWGKRVKRLLDSRTSINLGTGCWEYQGTNTDGYGQITIDYVFYYVHRLSAMIFHDYNPVTASFDMHVLHRCNNRCCWNPQHLYIGSNAQNIQDKMDAGNTRKGVYDKLYCDNGHEYTEENTYWSKRATGERRRQCRECRAIRDKESKQRKKLLNIREVG